MCCGVWNNRRGEARAAARLQKPPVGLRASTARYAINVCNCRRGKLQRAAFRQTGTRAALRAQHASKFMRTSAAWEPCKHQAGPEWSCAQAGAASRDRKRTQAYTTYSAVAHIYCFAHYCTLGVYAKSLKAYSTVAHVYCFSYYFGLLVHLAPKTY